MSGKSAILRQTALITLMAHMGSFVPASDAKIPLTDKIFTRVGASDNLSGGESTFMVEMNETASIINNITSRSLVLLDEIGRGTSTYDGISIAWSIVEHLHNSHAKPKTLFATHYHELNELENKLSRVKNFHVTNKEVGNKIIFLRKLAAGGSIHSFGIHVARMAGMPPSLIDRANEILLQLEESRNSGATGKAAPMDETMKKIGAPKIQLSIFDAHSATFEEIRNHGLSINHCRWISNGTQDAIIRRMSAAVTGLSTDSKAQAEQVRTVAIERLTRGIGRVESGEMAQIDDALRLHLDL
jgi:DNA mismatch repair protein MutS